jgi:Uncharacterized conserved protein
MGSWDVGNFDNDAALDYVGELMDELQGKVDEFFDSDEQELDDGEATVVPTVAIMQLLAEHTGAAPPKADLIKKWQVKYLKIFDEQIDDCEPEDGYKSRRRETISRTFKGLEKSSSTFWDKSGVSNGGGGSGGADGDSHDQDDDDEAPRAVATKPAPPKATVQSSSTGGSSSSASKAKRRFEFVEGGSSKFWEIELSGTTYTTTWGRIGTAGSSKTKECPTEAKAAADYDKLVEEKTGKGYEEV